MIAVDNKTAIDIAYNNGTTARNKHFLRVFHYIREQILHLRITMTHVSTDYQKADMFTKALGVSKFTQCRDWHMK